MARARVKRGPRGCDIGANLPPANVTGPVDAPCGIGIEGQHEHAAMQRRIGDGRWDLVHVATATTEIEFAQLTVEHFVPPLQGEIRICEAFKAIVVCRKSKDDFEMKGKKNDLQRS